jgi:hypothetical protein
MNPQRQTLVLESSVPAAAGGNAGLPRLRYSVPKDTPPVPSGDRSEWSDTWTGLAAVLSLAFVFVLGPGVALCL